MMLQPLVHASEEQRRALRSLEEAAALFASSDPALRVRGETVFLDLRQSAAAVEHALFALEHSSDPFVHFQCLSVVLEKLSSLALRQPSASLTSLETLRDFLLGLTLAHSRHDPTASTWPNYTRSRAFQTFAAVQVRLLGLELEDGRQNGQAAEVIDKHSHFIRSHIVDLVALPDPSSSTLFAKHASFSIGIGLACAMLDELSLAARSRTSPAEQQLSKRVARAVDYAGLSALQHRWVKSWMQEQILPYLLQSVIHALSTVLAQQQSTNSAVTLLAPLAALTGILEKVLQWRPIIAEPWAGLSGALNFRDTARLLSEDDLSAVNENDVDDMDDMSGAAGSFAVPGARFIPSPLADVYLSSDMIALAASAYRFASRADSQSEREGAVCLSKLRRCILAIASFAPVPGATSRADLGTDRQAAVLEVVKTLRADAAASKSRLLTDRGTSLLFLAQVYCVILSTDTDLSAALVMYGLDVCVNDLSGLSNDILGFAFDRRADSDEEEDVALLADETVRSLLSAWLTLLEAVRNTPAEAYVASLTFSAIVKPYIDARLHHAASSVTVGGEDEEELGESTESDQEAYGSTLIMLATLARQGDLSACLAHLRARTDRITQDLAAFYTPSIGANQVDSTEMKALESRWESLHWLLLISGHALADVSQGEVAMVPREVAALSNEGQGTALHLMRSLGVGLLEMLADAGPDKPQSPQVLQSVLWFSARCVPGYLLTRSTAVLSTNLDGEEGRQLLALLVLRIEQTMARWLSDESVIGMVALHLRSFALSEGVMGVLLTLPAFEQLVKAIIEGLGMLPAKTHKPLISALIGCVYASASSQSPEAYFARITGAVEERLAAIVHQPNFSAPSVFQRAETVDALLNVLDMLDGMAASTQPKSARAVFAFLSRFFDILLDLSRMYRDRVDVGMSIVRILRTLVGALDLGFGADEHTVSRLNGVVWRLLDGLPSAVLVGDSPGTALEEDLPFDGLCLVLELLCDLLLASDGDAHTTASAWFAPISHHQTGDVCLFGFSRVVPVLQSDVLSVSRVRIRLAQLTSRLFVAFGHRLVGTVVQESLSATSAVSDASGDCARLFGACVQALGLSLGFDETGAVLDALGACDALSRAVLRVFTQAPASNPDARQRTARVVAGSLMTPLLDTVLRMVLLEPLALSMLEAQLDTLRPLLHVVDWTANAATAAHADGHSPLQQHLTRFCATTPLVSLRASAGAKAASATVQDEARRRAALHHIVAQLAELGIALTAQSSTLDADATRHLNARVHEIAWNGRSEIQIR